MLLRQKVYNENIYVVANVILKINYARSCVNSNARS